jgi:hypothetical protein
MYESSFDVQKAYTELQDHHLTSTKAPISSVKVLGYITSAKIDNGSWHGTAENFILNWQEQICLCERLTPTSGHFSDEQKLTMLQTAVHPLQELRQVKATTALLKVHTKKYLDYEAYSSLLLSNASDCDIKFTPCPGMKDKVCMPKDKWFGIDQKTKDLWDQRDDKYKSVKLGYTKSSTSSPFSRKPPSKPSFPTKAL